MKRTLKVIVQESNIKVESVLHHQIGLTKHQIRHLKFVKDGIKKNGQRCRVNEVVYCGDILEIQLEEEQETSVHLEGEEGILDIIYEDEDILALNKPTGVVTHPQGVHYQDTLANQAAAYFRQKGEEHSVRPIGRLDKETSGIVIFAKNRVTAARLQEQRKEDIFRKIYIAIVDGELPVDDRWHVISKPMKQNTQDKLKMIIADDGKKAITRYQVITSCKEYSVVKLILGTGRTHQIRVHMESIGHPLIGDMLYGNAQKENGRALLHAWKVELIQPFSGERIRLETKIPDDMKSWVNVVNLAK